MSLFTDLKKIKCGKVMTNIDLSKYTTYKVGGIGKVLVIPKTVMELTNILKYAREKNIKHMILGNGSNLIFTGKEYNGILIKLDEFNELKIEKNIVTVGAGYPLTKLALRTARENLTGLEFAAGIPGTVGGAIYMNAGAYNSDMGYVVNRIKVLTDDYQIKTLYNKDLEYHYRSSFLQKNKNYICLEAIFYLRFGKKEAILEVINDRKARRLISQPLEFPSAGSVFRNPPNDFAGRLIEELGYKGKGVGDAIISEKHANFIVNKGSATGDDVKNLINKIQIEVKEKYDIELKLEQEIVE